jgi:Asp-tRNA(Asn)/Glu-tRNA(Gln) amidotransferase A subunit family amidase
MKNRTARRRFLKTVPVVVAGGLAAPAFAQQGQDEQSGRISKEALDQAEKVLGVDFSDQEQEQALRGVNRNLEAFEALRKVDISHDVEPPLVFHPYLPGKAPKPGATPGAKIKVALTPPPHTSKLDDLAFLPVTSLAPLVQRREVSSTDLTKMYLERLKTYGPKLNCVVTLTEELALAQAAQADREIRAGGYKGPLHGIPWGAKDLFATRGIPTTWGAGPYQNQVFDYDATIVERLRDAGAVLVAKLSMGALAQGDRWFRGQTKNPWNPDDPQRGGSSGSSAGPGSATAAGLVGFSIGTETRGSIISPSAANGVTGLRPTYGRVSRFGAMALSWTMDKIGPMCRSVEDCALVFNAIYGPDGRDDSVVDAPFVWNPDVPLSKLRIGYIKSEFELRPETAPAGGRGDAAGGRGDAAGGRGDAGGRGRGGISPEEQRRRREAQIKVLNEALDVYRAAGVTLHAIDLPLDEHLERDWIHSEHRSRRRLRPAHAQRRHPGSLARNLAEHVPHAPLRAGGRVPARAAGAHVADAGNGQADVGIRRIPVAQQQRQPRSHESDGPPRAGAQGGIRQQRAGGADGDGTALRRSDGAAHRARVRACDEVAHDESADEFRDEDRGGIKIAAVADRGLRAVGRRYATARVP